MIRFENVTKAYRTRDGRRTVLDDVSFEFPAGRNIGILGANGSGKSTLVRLLSGSELPDSGDIERDGLISFPMGFEAGFHPHLSGRDNVRLLARIYGVDIREAITFVEAFAELGDYFDEPIQAYSSGMRARLSFATSLAIDFDMYLIDEITEVGDARFREKCARAFDQRLSYANVVIVSHNPHTIRRYCDMGAVLGEGRIDIHDDIEDAIRDYAGRLERLG